jgi:hypothetical protein
MPIFRRGAINRHGRPRNIAASIAASGCRRTGNRRTLRRANETPAGLEAPFDDPIPRPHGRRLVTLEDAGNYITKLPKAEHEDAEWQGAMEALILVATLGGPTMFARIGVLRALTVGMATALSSKIVR